MVTKMQACQVEEVLSIWLQSNVSAHPFIPGSYWQQNQKDVAQALLQAEIYVKQEKAEITGFAGLQGEGYLAGLFVKSRHQGKGVGTCLLSYCKTKQESLRLHVYVENGKAVEFYQKNGFTITSTGINADTKAKEYTMEWKKK